VISWFQILPLQQGVRDSARTALAAAAAGLGAPHLPRVVSLLSNRLDRGFMTHVLGATLHSLLDACVPGADPEVGPLHHLNSVDPSAWCGGDGGDGGGERRGMIIRNPMLIFHEDFSAYELFKSDFSPPSRHAQSLKPQRMEMVFLLHKASPSPERGTVGYCL
jgi:hypothetical protein